MLAVAELPVSPSSALAKRAALLCGRLRAAVPPVFADKSFEQHGCGR
jgi:hypothetical protein